MAILHGISCAVQRHYSTVSSHLNPGWFGFVALLALKKSCIHEVQTKFIYKTFLQMGVAFRDESNDDN